MQFLRQNKFFKIVIEFFLFYHRYFFLTARLFLFAFFLLVGSSVFAQLYLPLNREYCLPFERQLNNKENFSHTALKPYLSTQINSDSLRIADSTHFKIKKYQHWIKRKLFLESLFFISNQHELDSGIDKLKFLVNVDPLFNFSYSDDFADTSSRADTTIFFTNTRGVMIRGLIGPRLAFMTSFLETQSFFPQYVDEYVKENSVVPGYGRVKPFKKSGYDYAIASGYVSFSPVDFLNIQLGHDKHFIGDGYRSLMLSDNAFNYPFIKINTAFLNNRIQYSNIYNQLIILERIPFSTTPEALFKPMTGSFHFLSIIPARSWQIGFFEGSIWPRMDSNGSLPFNWNYINPVILFNTAVYGFNGIKNTILGSNLKFKITNSFALYAQLVTSGNNRFGYQAGIKGFDLFKVKNLDIQLEYNTVNKGFYENSFKAENTFIHYNQPLNHPYFSGFDEVVSILDYSLYDFFFQGKFIYGLKNNSNINLSDSEISFIDFKLGYQVKKRSNLRIYTGFIDRKVQFADPLNNLNSNKTKLFYLGIRTNLGNQYLDF